MAFNFTSLQTPIITADVAEKNTVGRGIGILLPFRKITGGMFQISRTTEDQLKTNILNFVKTKKGERLFHPEFGLSLHEYLFEQMTDDSEFSTKIKKSIINDFSFWLPFAIITNIQISFPTQNAISINMAIKLLPSRANSTIVIFIDSSSNITAEIL
jgi:phage baseplate assembly protein W